MDLLSQLNIQVSGRRLSQEGPLRTILACEAVCFTLLQSLTLPEPRLLLKGVVYHKLPNQSFSGLCFGMGG